MITNLASNIFTRCTTLRSLLQLAPLLLAPLIDEFLDNNPNYRQHLTAIGEFDVPILQEARTGIAMSSVSLA